MDYRNINYKLHVDNARIKGQLKELAHRQQMKVDRQKQNTAYLASLMAYYHGPTSTSVVPPSPLPPFKFLPWPPATPKLPEDPKDDDKLHDI